MQQHSVKKAFFLLLLSTPIFHAYAQEEQQPPPPPVAKEFYNLGFPGFSGGFLYTFQEQKLYYGGSFRFDLFYGLDSDKPNASLAERGRWETYLEIGLFAYKGFTPHQSLLFHYLLGLNVSLETPRALKRNFLIPYLGFELGGLYMEEKGLGFTTSPLLGLNIISLPQLSLSVDTRLILNTKAFIELLGLRSQINLNFVL